MRLQKPLMDGSWVLTQTSHLEASLGVKTAGIHLPMQKGVASMQEGHVEVVPDGKAGTR